MEVTLSLKAARINTCFTLLVGNPICHDGHRKGFVNIKYNLDLLINTMSDRLKDTAYEILHITHAYLKENSQTFPVFHLIDPMNAWSAPPTSFTTAAIVQVSLHECIWHLPCISNADHSLQLQQRSKFVFCNTKLMSPDQQISTHCDFKWEAEENKTQNLNVS